MYLDHAHEPGILRTNTSERKAQLNILWMDYGRYLTLTLGKKMSLDKNIRNVCRCEQTGMPTENIPLKIFQKGTEHC